VVVTPEVIGAINCIYDARVPRGWLLSPGGDEISWMVSSLGLWYSGLNSRDAQFKTWLRGGRPLSYWLTGFFNPQGFLTAVQQEVTRGHKNDEWSLDSVSVATEVTEFLNPELIKAPPREGVFLHGLFLDGAGWDRPDRSLRESEPKKLFTPLPVMHVTAGMKGRGSKADSAGKGSDYGPYGGYECPVYKYPARTDRYLIFSVTLASREKKPSHWTLRGVALLCTTD
jgi:dynein heavy chain